jgi:predicted lipoprotein with Yx(FWY)xxD motif
MFKKSTSIALLLGMCFSGTALAQSTGNSPGSTTNPNSVGVMSAPAEVKTTDKGKTLVDAKGMTLYTYDKDAAGKSACNASCAKIWPPLRATAGASASGNWSIVSRSDGSKQWAYKGKPVYTFSKDTKPGETTGAGVKMVWQVAQP